MVHEKRRLGPLASWPEASSKTLMQTVHASAPLPVPGLRNALITYQRVDQLVGDTVALDVLIDLRLVVAKIAEGIKHLSDREMGQMTWNQFGRDFHPPKFHNRPHRRTRPSDDGLTAENAILGDDMGVFCLVGSDSLSC